jgi:hypothetical protein
VRLLGAALLIDAIDACVRCFSACGINPGTEAAPNRFAGMASARHSKPTSTKLRFWRVSIPGGKRPEYVGLVEAPDQQSAEAAAVKQFRLSDEDRKRLVVRTRN